MNVTAEWVIVAGRPFVAVHLPGGHTVKVPQYTAWHLKNAIERVLATPPPHRADNGSGGTYEHNSS